MPASDAQAISPLPIAIGGLGGSGTRVLASLVRELRVDIGSFLNNSLDNLWFTFLLMHPDWHFPAKSPERISMALDLFIRAMTTGLEGTLSVAEETLLSHLENKTGPTFHGFPTADVACSLRASKGPEPGAFAGWGWKEPNTHYIVEQLANADGRFVYVHVIRNGLDIAFSGNRNQLRNWGPLFALNVDEATLQEPRLALDFWLMANARTIGIAARRFGQRFVLMDYYDLCTNPYNAVVQIARAANLPIPKKLSVNGSASPIKVRTDQMEIHASQFSAQSLARLEDLGYVNATESSGRLVTLPERCDASARLDAWLKLAEATAYRPGPSPTVQEPG
ncbi:MAG: hypothetical protein KDJ29_18335 [Hyphomicrobiales bacterium]|nr:hypothetical protein [Nitratireductor sp.]MCC2098856.1 hypothetical protein [Hyphomicrobiales bacterium]